MDKYLTVENETSEEYEIKRSRFIGYVKPVSTQAEAEAFIASVKQKHWDARHNVYAYILREGNVKRYSDDGEPQGTAGVPVLDVLEKCGVCDVCVVVTRYFGGILLGGGGLVRAYSHTASIAVEKANRITMSLCVCFEIKCDYSFYGKLGSLIPECGGVIESSDFTDDVLLSGYIPADSFEMLNSKVIEASAGRFSLTGKDKKYEKINN
jgi:uncharacterized YigZ family protein